MIYLVPTPIGNSGDITSRSIEALQASACIIAEDPRVLHQLLLRLNITLTAKIESFGSNGPNEVSKISDILRTYQDKHVSVVTDAGMPGISDPGHVVVKLAQQNNLEYTVLPGASALITAVAASGLVTNEFTFLGFLPHKKGRMTALKSLATSPYPVVLYESVHRVAKLITELTQYCKPETEVFIGRELSKKFEQYWVGEVSNLQEYKLTAKGEFVLVIKPVTHK